MAKNKKTELEENLEKAQTKLDEANEGVKSASAEYKGYVDAGYTPSDTVKALGDEYAAAKKNLASYAPYTNPNAAALQSALSAVVNRSPFKFNTDGDAMYERYRNAYAAAGKQAMKDTMGQAAALTGGYGNSYAATAGARAYNDYLSKMDEIVPELYRMALDKYNAEGDRLAQNYSILANDDAAQYSRWANERGYLADLADRAQSAYATERGFDYGQWGDRGDAMLRLADLARAAYANAADAESTAYGRAYTEGRDAISDQRYADEWARSILESDREWERALDRDARSDYESDRDYGYKAAKDARSAAEDASAKALDDAMTRYQITGDASALADYFGVPVSQIESYLAGQGEAADNYTYNTYKEMPTEVKKKIDDLASKVSGGMASFDKLDEYIETLAGSGYYSPAAIDEIRNIYSNTEEGSHQSAIDSIYANYSPEVVDQILRELGYGRKIGLAK